jgi:hypothetical protein
MTKNQPLERPSSRNKAAHAMLANARKQHLGNWGAYAAAAGAALAMSTNASAGIIYSGVQDKTVTLANEGNVDTFRTTQFSVAQVIEKARANNGARRTRIGLAALVANTSTRRLSFALAGSLRAAKLYTLGQAVLMNGSRGSSGLLRAEISNGQLTQRIGPWGPGTVTGFVGFISTQTGDLGWIDVKVFDRNDDGYPDELEIIDSAYNNTPGGAIDAGQTSSLPEPGTAALGLLALGAVGILALRKRRKELTAN